MSDDDDEDDDDEDDDDDDDDDDVNPALKVGPLAATAVLNPFECQPS